MRAAFLALMAISTFSTIAATPVEARDYPYCIKGKDWLSPVGDCRFTSYQQCQATASGRSAYCERNPFYSRADMRGDGRWYHRGY
jgi:hypothetical protein